MFTRGLSSDKRSRLKDRIMRMSVRINWNLFNLNILLQELLNRQGGSIITILLSINASSSRMEMSCVLRKKITRETVKELCILKRIPQLLVLPFSGLKQNSSRTNWNSFSWQMTCSRSSRSNRNSRSYPTSRSIPSSLNWPNSLSSRRRNLIWDEILVWWIVVLSEYCSIYLELLIVMAMDW